MKYLKIGGVAWGLFYFGFGALKSFTMNSNDTWASVALFFGLFLFPLPIAVMAIWRPKLAAKALAKKYYLMRLREHYRILE